MTETNSDMYLHILEGRRRAALLEADELANGDPKLTASLAPFLLGWTFVEGDVRNYFGVPENGGSDGPEAQEEFARLNEIKEARVAELLATVPRDTSP